VSLGAVYDPALKDDYWFGPLDVAGWLDGAYVSVQGGAGPIEGVLDVTLDPLTLVSAGAIGISGGLSKTLDAVTVSAAGVAGIAGVADVGLDGFGLAAAGVQPLSGLSEIQLADGSLVSVGTVDVAGTLDLEVEPFGLLASGESGAGPSPAVQAPSGAPARRKLGHYTWTPKKELEEERVFREMREAARVPQEAMRAMEAGRQRSLAALRLSNQARKIESGLNPSPSPMTQADKNKLEAQKMFKRLESAERLRQEKEKYAKKAGMNAKMAKVRAAKRKTGKR